MIKLGLIGNGFVGGAARQLECHQNIVCVYDIDPEKCMPKGTTLETVAACDLIFVAVPTPSRKDGTCHINIVVSVVAALKKANAAANIVIRSTVPPGTSKSLGTNFMPEFLTEANANQDFRNNPLWILGCMDKNISPILQQLLTNAKTAGKIASDSLTIMSPTEAEMVKYVRNCFLSVKVAFFNELYDACQQHKCDYDAVRLAASADARIGSGHTLVPGPDGRRGFGGHCFPKDVAAWCTFNSQEHSIVDAARKRNLELDRPEKDWEQDKGRAVVE